MSESDDNPAVEAEDQSNGFGLNSEAELTEPEYVESTLSEPEADLSDEHSEEQVAPVADAEPEGQDDSIEAYMNRLLQRVQGTSTQPTEIPATEAAPAVTSSAISETHSSDDILEDTVSSTEPIDPNAPLVARSHAPETNRNLSAMRELANNSARSAITQSVRMQTRNTQIQAMSRFAAAGVVGLCGLGAIVYDSFEGNNLNGLLYIILACVMVVAGIFIYEGVGLLRDARRRLLLAEAGELSEHDDVDEEPSQGE